MASKIRAEGTQHWDGKVPWLSKKCCLNAHSERHETVTGPNGKGIAAGRPPRGGVENLVFSSQENGTRSITYRHQGEDYYIRYTPAETSGCFQFETKTASLARPSLFNVCWYNSHKWCGFVNGSLFEEVW